MVGAARTGGPVRHLLSTVRGLTTPRGPQLPCLPTPGMATRHHRSEPDLAGLPVRLSRSTTGLRLPVHRLLHLDGAVPELAERAGRVPLQGKASEQQIEDRA